MRNTHIWIKKAYTRNGIREIVRIVYNPYDRSASEILKEWVLPEFLHQCYAKNYKIK